MTTSSPAASTVPPTPPSTVSVAVLEPWSVRFARRSQERRLARNTRRQSRNQARRCGRACTPGHRFQVGGLALGYGEYPALPCSKWTVRECAHGRLWQYLGRARTYVGDWPGADIYQDGWRRITVLRHPVFWFRFRAAKKTSPTASDGLRFLPRTCLVGIVEH